MDKSLRSRDEILAAVASGQLRAEQGYALLRGAGPTGRPDPAPANGREPIAVIGLAGRFPGAVDAERFWALLEQGVDGVGEVPPDRWPLAGFYDARPGQAGRSISKWGGFLDDVAGFDPHFFGLSAREAEVMDPQQRLFLMEAWHALEDAGYAGPVLDGRNVGVFAGCAEGDYYDLVRDAGRLYTPHAFMGAATAMLAARIAYHLNLRGPALSVDTACSASLVSLHLACESLRRGDCEMALAGGVYVMATPRLHLLATSAGMLSPTGRCHAFGRDADGFVPAEAVGVVLLKPLAQALADGDPVRAVIEGSGINQDGRSNGITAPNAPSQAQLALSVYERFGIDPATIGYVETHGTGTALGDPIEVEGLGAAFREYTTARGFCRLGSAKSTIGHAQLAAGIVGFIKLVLALERGVIPPTLHADTPNPRLGLDDSPFRIALVREDWPPAADGRRRGAVSAFGFSGTNAHVVARAHDGSRRAAGPAAPAWLVVLSGHDAAALAERARSLLAWLGEHPHAALADVAFTLLCGGAHFGQRRGFVVADVPALRRELLHLSATSPAARRAGDRAALKRQADEVLALMPATVAGAGASYRKGLEWLARAYEAGADVDAGWERVFLDQHPCRMSLPAIRFRCERHWVTPAVLPRTLVVAAADPLPEHHRVRGHAVVPGAAWISAALAVAGGDGLSDVRLQAALPRRAGERLEVDFERRGEALEVRTREGGTRLMQARCVAGATDMPPVPGWQGPDLSESAASLLYERFAAAGLEYGASLRCLRALARDGELVRARVTVDGGTDRMGAVAAEALDASFQLAAALADPALPLPLMVLDRIDRLQLPQALPRSFDVLLRGRRDAGGDWLATLWLVAADGRALGYVDGLRFAPVGAAGTTAEAGIRAAIHHSPDDVLVAWTPAWRAVDVGVQPDTDARLLDCPRRRSGETPDASVSRSLLPAIAVARQIAADIAAGRQVPPLVQRYRNDDPAGEALAGFWRCVVREYPSLRVACIGTPDDLPEQAVRRAAAAVLPPHGMAEARCTADGSAQLLGYRELALPEAASALAAGTVVISGGTGRLGRLLGERLAAAGARVALLGRSARPQASAGPQPLFEVTADVADESSLRHALDVVRQAAGPITGVVHAAGELDDCLVAGLDPVAALAAARAKVTGAVLLDRLTAKDPLACFVVYGALAGRAGNSGQSVYGYANRYLAAFARERSTRGDRNGATLAIDWPLWADGGMQPPPALAASLRRSVGLAPMPADIGLDALAAGLALTTPELLLGYGAPVRLREAVADLGGDSREADADLAAAADVLRPRLVQGLKSAVAANLSMHAAVIEADAPLADYGFDSISVTALADEINRAYGTEFSPATFFEVKSIDGLADIALLRWPGKVARALGQAAPAPRTDALPLVEAPGRTPPAPALAPVEPIALPAADNAAMQGEPIAVVGMDLRFPGADDSRQFWANLCAGVDPIREIPAGRWDWRAIHGDPAIESGRTDVRWGGFIDDIDRFDAAFFGIAPIEADAMDPQQRLLLESAWRAIEHAGHGPRSLAGSRTSVFVGCAGYDYAAIQRAAGLGIEAYTATGIAPALLSNRLSFLLDLCGASETVDTACSSSLVALDRAMQALRGGHCEAALVSAASAILSPELHIAFARAGMLNPDGRCRAFDAGARGYVRSEGVATVYLKPLSRARADGDTVHAVILGSAVNHGGRATSLTAPNAAAQAAVIRDAWKAAGIEAAQVGYIEAHGTGTALGDPVEVRGLSLAFDAAGPGTDTPCLLGTVKSHIGHLEGTAGLAGFITATLAVREATVPGLLHFDAPNPLIDLGATPLALARRTQPWQRPGRRIAGVSSFGFGGTNAHVVVAEAPQAPDIDIAAAGPQLIVLSARTEADLARRIADLRGWLQGAATPADASPAGPSPGALRAMVASLLEVPADAVPLDEPLVDLGMSAVQLQRLARRIASEGITSGAGPPALPARVGVDSTVRSIAAALAPAAAEAPAPPQLADLAFSLLHGRDAMVERLAFIAADHDTIVAVLAALDEGREPPVRVYRGHPEASQSLLRRLFEDADGQSPLQGLADAGRLDDLAELWVGGVDLPRSVLFPRPRQRLPLPPYRFEGERHWFGVHGGNATADVGKPAPALTCLGARWQRMDDPSPANGSKALVLACAAEAPLAARLDEVRTALAPAMGAGGRVEATVVVTPGSLPQLAVVEAVAALLDSWHAEDPHLRAVAVAAPAAVPALGRLARSCRPGSALRQVDDGFEVRVLQPLTDPLPARADGWRRGARVLITGGAGGVGRLLACHLAATQGARLLLVGRRAADPQATALLAECARLGGDARYLAADVSSDAGARRAVDVAIEHFGGLDDIVHAAGVLADGLQSEAGAGAFEAVLRPKVEGLLALERAVEDRRETPRMVLVSSLAGWLGNPGQGAYAAANRFMDAYAEARAATGASWCSIAWPLWADGGMRPPAAELRRLQRETGLALLPTAQALAAQDRVLSTALPFAAVAWGERTAPAIRRLTGADQGTPGMAAPDTARVRQSTLVVPALFAEVLGCDVPPPADASLDEAGFSSLTAVRLRHRLREQAGLDWPVARLVGFASVGALIAALESAAPEAAAPEPAAPAPDDAAPEVHSDETDGPLAQGQRLLWIQHKLDPDGFAYHLPVLLELAGGIGAGALQHALDTLVARHPVLRTRYVECAGEPRRQVDAPQAVVLARLTAPAGTPTEQLAWLRGQARRPFRLATAAPVDFSLVESMAETPWLLCRFHHIAVDGLSLRRIFDEFGQLLAGAPLDPAPEPFGVFVAAEAAYLASPGACADRDFWRRHLARKPAPLDLPGTRLPADNRAAAGESLQVHLDAPVRQRLGARTGGGTLFHLAMAAWAAVLARFVDDGRVRLLVPTAGRHEARFEDCVGHCVNPLLVEIEVTASGDFDDARERTRRTWEEASLHARWPLARQLADLAGSDARTPALTEVAHAGFYFQAWMGSAEGGVDGMHYRRLDLLRHEGEFPLVLELVDGQDGLAIVLKHDPDVVEPQVAALLLARYRELLCDLAAGGELPLSSLWQANAAELAQVGSQASTDAPPVAGASALLRRHAAERPDQVAVLHGNLQWSRAQVDAHADVVARSLRAAGAGRGDVVGVLMQRGIELPSALLGVMRSGAAYLPLDPAFPAERRDYMLDDAGARYLLLRRADALPVAPGLVPLYLEDLAPEASPAGSSAWLPEPADADLAYVLHTSGSTGVPKGVEVSHGSLARFLAAMAAIPGFSPADRLLALTTVAFDISGLELLLPLAAGGSVVVLDAVESRDATRLRRQLETPGITIAQATPATWRMLLAAGWQGSGSLRRILVGGEPLVADLADALVALVPEVWNMYGPTETTIWSTTGRVRAGERVTVGRAIAGTHCHVIDADGRPCAIGVTGELWIGGAGVASGYHGQPQLTADRFVAHEGQRVYRSGDRARWLVDGRLEVSGRLDQQLKVNGVRIEPGEIEAAVVRKLGDRACAVTAVANAGGLAELVAFVQPDPGAPGLSSLERTTRLRGWLPDHMVPQRWVSVDALPTTLNGKLDRNALAALAMDTPTPAPAPAESIVASGHRLLPALRQLLAEQLQRDPATLDATAPLTLLGVDSLRAVGFAEAMTRHFGVDVRPTDLFSHPDLASLAQHVGTLQAAAADDIEAPAAAPVTAPAPSAMRQATRPAAAAATDIAVVGMAGRFPDAPDLDTFWANLLAGRVSTREIPPGRWDWHASHDPRHHWAAFLDDIAGFDPGFFGMTPQEAASADPQQRLFLMEAWKALADTGRDPQAYAGSRCGVYVGATFGDYARLLEAAGEIDAFSMLGGGPALIPARIAYQLDLKGPAVAVDTACSASLVAVHQACQAIAAGEVGMALAGGVYLMCTPFGQRLSAAANILSPEGRCRPFSEAADGIVIGEAVGVVVLKPLARARADGDPIRAVIKATGTNQDGRSNGIAAPMAPAQGALIGGVVERAGVAAGSIGYIETHGTGTRLGDPVELEGLRLGLDPVDGGPPCHLGSVKANVGHSYQAAGITGLIKTVLCLEHGLLPPQPGVGTPNPLLRLDGTPFRIATRAQPWPHRDGPRRAGVSAFGLSGTNAHVLLEAWPDAPLERPSRPLPFSLVRCWVDEPSPRAEPAGVGDDPIEPVARGAAATDRDVRATVLAELAGLGGCASADIRGDALLEADLGMDSIKLMGLVSRLKRMPDARTIDASALPGLRTVDELLAAAGGGPALPGPTPDATDAPVVPMLDAQYLFLLGHHLIRSSSLCSWLRLRGALDRERLQRAWQALVMANPGLRTVLRTDAPDGPLGSYRTHLLARPTVPPIACTDLSALDPAAREARLAEVFAVGLNREWVLDRWPLHDLALFRLQPGEHALVLCNEHLVSDGIGNQLILRRLLEHYVAEAGEGPPPPTLDDAEYIRQLAALNAHQPEPGTAAESSAPYSWNPGGRGIRDFVPRFAVEVHECPAARTRQLQVAADRLGVGLNALLLLALLRAAQRTAPARSAVVQMPTSGRVAGDTDASGCIGCFAQNVAVTLPTDTLLGAWPDAARRCRAEVEQRLAGEEDWRQARAMATVLRNDITLHDGTIDPGLRPLFRARLGSNLYAPYIGDTGIATRYGSLQVTGYRAGTVNGPATIDLLHELFDGRLHASWNYDAGFFEPHEIQGLRVAFERELDDAIAAADVEALPAPPPATPLPASLLDAVESVCGRRPTAADAGQSMEAVFGLDSLRRVRLLSRLPAELRRDAPLRTRMMAARTLAELADLMGERAGAIRTPADSPPDIPLAAILRQMVQRPDAPAIVGPGGSLGYGELDALTTSLANTLRGLGIGAGDRVGVLLDRGHLLPAAILAVIRAGAAYVPLDPGLPRDRIAYITGHAGLAALLSETAQAGLLHALYGDPGEAPRLLLSMDADPNGRLPAAAIGPVAWRDAPSLPLPLPDPADPMVVLYTSGSTGRPKGVVLDHAGYANRLRWHQRQFQLQPGEAVLQKTTVCFDVSVWELLWPLMQGGVMHVVEASTARDPWALAQVIRERRIVALHFVPSMFGEFVNALGDEDAAGAFPDLRWVVLSGEALPVPDVRKWFHAFGHRTRLANLYGPTEASIDVTCQVIDAPPAANSLRVPIGAAIDGVQLYVLDAALRPVADGAQGELCIGGVQLADGYHAAPELTAAAFVPFAAADLVGKRVYRTGDLVRRTPDGVFDYLGRLDSQVKIRGNRIELGEIEAVLRELDGVREAALTVDGEGAASQLVAWLVATASLDADAIRAHCVRRLPAYMLPARVEFRAELPRNANGKLDRKALDVAPGDRCAPLAPAQRWLLQHFPAPHAWWGYTRFGCRRALRPDALLDAYRHLVRRHEALRTVFSTTADGAWQQRVLAPGVADRADLRIIDAGELDGGELDALASRELRAACEGFDLERWPLDAAVALRRASDDWEFCLANHHINGDFVSGDVLFREFWETYDALEAGADLPVQPAPPGPADLAGRMAQLEREGGLDDCRDHWARIDRNCHGFALRPDRPQAANAEAATRTLHFELDSASTRRLLDDARQALGMAVYPLLAAPLYRALGEAAGHETAVVSHRMAGRAAVHAGVDYAGSVGNFALHYPVPVDLGRSSMAELAQRVAAALAAVPRAGLGYDWFGSRLGRDCYPDERLTPLRLNYLGRLPDATHGAFRFAPQHHNQRLAPADAVRSAELELHLGLRGANLWAQVSFASPRWEGGRVQALLDRYEALLVAFAGNFGQVG